MTKLEKVIKGLEICIRVQDNEQCPNECPYRRDICYGTSGLMADALELLKTKYKPRESRKMLPCKCGCKRREHGYRFGGSNENSEGLICKKCGFEVWGKNATDVIRKWNEAVTQNDEA